MIFIFVMKADIFMLHFILKIFCFLTNFHMKAKPSSNWFIITARAYARAVLRVVILSVSLSVCLSVCLSHAWIVTKLNDALQIFWYHTKGQSLCYSDTNNGWWATPPSLWNLRSKWPTPFEKRRLRPISAHNVSTVMPMTHAPETGARNRRQKTGARFWRVCHGIWYRFFLVPESVVG